MCKIKYNFVIKTYEMRGECMCKSKGRRANRILLVELF